LLLLKIKKVAVFERLFEETRSGGRNEIR
jgi:hypothetical protein